MSPGSDMNAEPVSSGPRFGSGRPRACELCKSRKKRCTHQGGEHSFVVDSDLVMETRLRKRSQREVDIAENRPFKFTSAIFSRSSHIRTKKTEGSKDRPLRSGSSRKSLPESPVAEKTTSTTEGTKVTMPPGDETAAGKAIIPKPPTAAMQGSIAMSVHSTFARELQCKLNTFEAKFQAGVAAHQAMQESAQSVRDTVQEWVDAWTSGQ